MPLSESYTFNLHQVPLLHEAACKAAENRADITQADLDPEILGHIAIACVEGHDATIPSEWAETAAVAIQELTKQEILNLSFSKSPEDTARIAQKIASLGQIQDGLPTTPEDDMWQEYLDRENLARTA